MDTTELIGRLTIIRGCVESIPSLEIDQGAVRAATLAYIDQTMSCIAADTPEHNEFDYIMSTDSVKSTNI